MKKRTPNAQKASPSPRKVTEKTQKKQPLPQTTPLPSPADPLGSYTGIPLNQREIPTQDADDL